MYMPMVNVNLPLPKDLLERVDEARRGTPRTQWIRQALERALPVDAPQPTLEDIFDNEAERIDTTALMEAGRAQEQAMLEAGAVPTGTLPQGVAYASHPEDGHLHRSEAYGQSYLNAGGRWSLRRCTLCGKDLPPKRV